MTATFWPLDIEMLSAKGLKNENVLSKMDVYIVSSISSDRRSTERTPVDRKGGKNPRWKNFRMRFYIEEEQMNQITVMFQIISRRVLGDKTIGYVRVPVKTLMEDYEKACEDGGSKAKKRSASYQVNTLSGKLKGTLCFMYSIGDKFEVPEPEGNQCEEYNQTPPANNQSYASPIHQYIQALQQPPQEGIPPFLGPMWFIHQVKAT